jgi:hypothetical protein
MQKQAKASSSSHELQALLLCLVMVAACGMLSVCGLTKKPHTQKTKNIARHCG